MPSNFNFVTEGRLHGDHGDDTGEYQRQLETLQNVIGPIGTPMSAPGTAQPARVEVAENPVKQNVMNLTYDEQQEFARLRPEFEPEGLLGDYHADHSDATGDYNARFERYITLLGVDMPKFRGRDDSNKPIDGEGRIVSPAMKAHLAEIIAEERKKLSEKV